MTTEEIKENIARYSNLLYQRGLVGAAGGNVSIKTGDNILITAGGRSLRNITADEILVLDMQEKLIEGRKDLKPSKEVFLHINVYRAREDVDCVIHAHPVYATSFATSGKTIPMITASSKLKLIGIPLIEYADPGSEKLATYVYQGVSRAPLDISAVLLEAHGLIAFSNGIENCFNIAELVEETAKIAYVSGQIKKM